MSTSADVAKPCRRATAHVGARLPGRQPLVVHPGARGPARGVPGARLRLPPARRLRAAALGCVARARRPGRSTARCMIGRILPLPTPTPTLVVSRPVRGRSPSAVALVVLVVRDRAPRVQTGVGVALFLLYLEWMVISFSYGKVDHDRFALPRGAGRAAHGRTRRPAGHDTVTGGWVVAAHGSGRRRGDVLPRRGRQGPVRRVGLGQLHDRSRGRSSVAAPCSPIRCCSARGRCS